MSNEFHAYMINRGVIHQCTMPYTLQQNGVAERKNRTLMDMARCIVKGKSLSNVFWMEAIMCANYVLNTHTCTHTHMEEEGGCNAKFSLGC